MKSERECGYTGKLKFTAVEVQKEIDKAKKATFGKFLCKCKAFHLVIRRRKRCNGMKQEVS